MEHYHNCNTDYANSIFHFDRVKKCFYDLGIDINCIQKNLENKPPITGDNVVFTDNRTPYIIKMSDLLNGSPKYFDPENDYLNRIRIAEIHLDSGMNGNVLLTDRITFKGVDIEVGQIIEVTDIENGELVYIPRDTNRSSNSWFTWEASDNCNTRFTP